MAQMPSVGRIVHYRLTEADALRINKRRADFDAHRRTGEYKDTGYMAHYGNTVSVGDVFPAIVVRAFESVHGVNAQVFLDGTESLWVTSIAEGDKPGHWSWPPRT
jgi:hypothetical protein